MKLKQFQVIKKKCIARGRGLIFWLR